MLGLQSSSQSSGSKFSVRPDIPEHDPRVRKVYLIGDLTLLFAEKRERKDSKDEKAFTPIWSITSVDKE